MLALAAALVLAAPPAKHPPHAGWRTEDGVPASIAMLFPGAKSEHVKSSKQAVVGPIKRSGLWGYARDFKGVSTGGVGFATFQLVLVPLPTGKAPPATAQEAIDLTEASKTQHVVLALIALDGNTKVIGKPKGWPLESDVNLDCMGDLCGMGHNSVKKLTVLDKDKPAVGVEYVENMGEKFAVAAVSKNQVVLSKPLVTGDTDDLTGCERSSRVHAYFLYDCQVWITFTEKCDVKSESCEGLCAGYSKNGLKISSYSILDLCGK